MAPIEGYGRSSLRNSTDASNEAWRCLVQRSIQAWDDLYLIREGYSTTGTLSRDLLLRCDSIDRFLTDASTTAMFWFFQHRQAFLDQGILQRWNPDNLHEYVLLPAAPGYVSRKDCFFISHYWRNKDHPDQDGQYLRLFQDCLRNQTWSYVWIDWTCCPQAPRTLAEEKYFFRSLETVPAIIRNAGFMWHYPPFEARLWILYEVAEAVLTSDGDFTQGCEDIETFTSHVHEMCNSSVRGVLKKYNYRCKNASDQAFLVSWLELLVLIKKIGIGLIGVRRLMDHLTWQGTQARTIVLCDVHGLGALRLEKFKGLVTFRGEEYLFTPFPIWGSHRPRSSEDGN